MREIKFRAWLTNGEGITYSNGDHMEYDITVKNGKYADVESGWDIHGLYDYPIMQYTGLKDKNGVEIYERDIIANASELYEITFMCGAFLATNKNDEHWLLTIANGSKVIGNIYENPELLEQK